MSYRFRNAHLSVLGTMGGSARQSSLAKRACSFEKRHVIIRNSMAYLGLSRPGLGEKAENFFRLDRRLRKVFAQCLIDQAFGDYERGSRALSLCFRQLIVMAKELERLSRLVDLDLDGTLKQRTDAQNARTTLDFKVAAMLKIGAVFVFRHSISPRNRASTCL